MELVDFIGKGNFYEGSHCKKKKEKNAIQKLPNSKIKLYK